MKWKTFFILLFLVAFSVVGYVEYDKMSHYKDIFLSKSIKTEITDSANIETEINKDTITTTLRYPNENIVTVPLEEREDGYYILVFVNGVPMKFLVDSGCSGMTIGYTEYMFLKSQGQIREQIINDQQMQLANGKTCGMSEIVLDSVNVGSVMFNNVQCLVNMPDSTGKVYDAPSLMGFKTFFKSIAKAIIVDPDSKEFSIVLKKDKSIN